VVVATVLTTDTSSVPPANISFFANAARAAVVIHIMEATIVRLAFPAGWSAFHRKWALDQLLISATALLALCRRHAFAFPVAVETLFAVTGALSVAHCRASIRFAGKEKATSVFAHSATRIVVLVGTAYIRALFQKDAATTRRAIVAVLARTCWRSANERANWLATRLFDGSGTLGLASISAVVNFFLIVVAYRRTLLFRDACASRIASIAGLAIASFPAALDPRVAFERLVIEWSWARAVTTRRTAFQPVLIRGTIVVEIDVVGMAMVRLPIHQVKNG
jgi:DNA-binding transcriptional ArsR family regulator